MYAIVKISGKQFRVSSGDIVKVPSLETESGKAVSFDNVLMVDNGKNVSMGTPSLKGASVTGKVLEHGRDKKVLIYKKKRRKGYQRKNGHRQGYSLVQIDKISLSAAKKKAPAKKSGSEEKSVKKEKEA